MFYLLAHLYRITHSQILVKKTDESSKNMCGNIRRIAKMPVYFDDFPLHIQIYQVLIRFNLSTFSQDSVISFNIRIVFIEKS